MKEHDIFLAAIDILDPAQRKAYLAGACAGDQELLRQVDSLLEAQERSGEFLNVPVLRQMGGEPALHLLGDTRINPSGEPGEIDLSFLQPSTMPDSLGRMMHYEIREFIGRGGCGMVFKALDERLNRTVAIKVMLPELAATSPARKRFLREARATAAIRHENVIGIHTVEEQPLPFLVMEYIAGETLQQRLDRTGPLDVREVLRIGKQIASGLAAAHDMKLIHRDIKPGNILLEDGTAQLKVTDFGLARSADDASVSHSGVIAGTPLYMSPEQTQGGSIDHRSDLFSLGSVLYAICTGRPPFRASSALAVMKRVAEEQPRPIQDIIPELPNWLVAIIAKLHAKDPDGRFASAQEVASLLERCLSEYGQHGGPQWPANDLALLPQAQDEKQTGEPQSPHVEPISATANRPVRSLSRGLTVAAVVGLVLFALVGFTEATGVTNVRGTVIRLFSPEGTLVLEIDDPEVSVSIDGEEMVITGTGVKEIRLKSGQYQVLASKNGEVVRQELVTVTNNGRTVLRVSRETAPTSHAVAITDLEIDRKAAEYVLSYGGIVRIDDRSDDLTDASMLPKRPFRLTFIGLKGNRRLTDSFFAAMRETRHLTGIGLDNAANVTDAALANFQHNKQLKYLGTWGADVSAAGMAHFRDCPHLHSIFLGNSKFNDEDMTFFATFSGLPKMTALLITNCPVTDRGLSELQGADQLLQLHLGGTRVTDAGMRQLTSLPNLSWLNLDRTAVGDAGLAHLQSCPKLKTLSLLKTRVTTKGIADFQKVNPRCTITWDGGVIEP